MKICLSMITVDRGEVGRINYLDQTLRSFEQSGLWQSKTPFEFHLFDSGSKNLAFIPDGFHFEIHSRYSRLRPRINTARALYATPSSCDWVIFCEDDIEVCKDFLDGAAAWIEKHANDSYRIITFYTPYKEVEWSKEKNQPYWDYPVPAFYGTQCFAIRRTDAYAVGEYLLNWDNCPEYDSSYDLAIKQWHKDTYPDCKSIMATVPSFVQHNGKDSVLNPGRFHTCGSYPGSQYSALAGAL